MVGVCREPDGVVTRVTPILMNPLSVNHKRGPVVVIPPTAKQVRLSHGRRILAPMKEGNSYDV